VPRALSEPFCRFDLQHRRTIIAEFRVAGGGLRWKTGTY
jgi:hypothetical protein